VISGILTSVMTQPASAAKVGDKLVTTQFTNSITRGFAGVGEPNVAVCLLPGTEVAFENDIEFEGGLGFFLNRTESTWTSRICITMRSNSRMASSCC
jgi:hypothetical protein